MSNDLFRKSREDDVGLVERRVAYVVTMDASECFSFNDHAPIFLRKIADMIEGGVAGNHPAERHVMSSDADGCGGVVEIASLDGVEWSIGDDLEPFSGDLLPDIANLLTDEELAAIGA